MDHPRTPENAVTRRIAMLSSQWLDFASDTRARVLCWRLAADEPRMLDAFLALQLDERTAEHDDMFLSLQRPFADASEYGATLCSGLIDPYERDRTLLLEEGLRASWFAPPQEPSESGDAYLVRCCSSFASHHELPGHLVLILQPTAIRDVAGYETWLLEIAELLPERLRIIVVDAARAPVWLRLSEQGRKRVTTREAALDTPGALAEISQNAGELDTPGGQFRETFLQLSAALGAQDLPRALRAGQQALAIAAEQGWFELSVPIHAVLGSALAADGKADDARLQFESAEQNALRGQSEGDPSSRDVCAKLRLQSRLGLGSALIAAEDYTEAARVFEDTVPIAAVAGDTSVQLECYRLAAFCYERADAPDTAFARARAGLELAKLLPRETLATTNFPLLAAAVLELCEGAGHSDLRAGLEREIAALDGESTPAAINPTDGPA